VLLPEIAQVGRAMAGGRAVCAQDRLELALHLPVAGLGPRGIRALERLDDGAHEIVAQIGRQHPPGRERRGRRRHDHAGNPELARDRHGVERPAAAVGDQRVVARVEAALGGDAAHRERHLHVGQPDDAGRRGRTPEPERRADLLVDGPGGARQIERHRAPEEAGGVDPAEHEIGVGDGRLGAAPRVTDRPGIGARALRAEGECAARVDPRDRSAAGTHFLDVDHRDPDGMAVHLVLVRRLHLAALDDRALGGGAAHVERDQPVRAEDAGQARTARHAGGRPGLHRVHGLRSRGIEREGAAVRLGDQELAAEATRLEPLTDGAEVAVHDRLNVRVHDGRAGALVLAPLLGDPVRRRDGDARELTGHDLGGALLVGRIAIREQEDDRDRLDAVGGELARGGAHRLLVQRRQHLARRGQAPGNFAAAAARHERRGAAVQHVVHPQEIAAADLQDVAEPLGGHEAGRGALALQERVDPDGRAVDHQPTIGQPHAGLVHAAQDAGEELAGRAEGLGVDDNARGLVERDEIREGTADVDADSHKCALAARAAWPSRRALRTESRLL
jgi:hypothetical protein